MNSFLKQVVLTLIISAGLIFLGFFIYRGFRSYADRDRVITVRGLAEREVMANKVTWPLVVKTTGNDMQLLYNKVNSNKETVLDFLHRNNITDAEISVGPATVWDREAQTYYSTDAPYRFNVTQVITVTSAQVEQVNKLIQRQGELMEMGVALSTDYQYTTTYEFTGLNEIKPEMIAEATHNAREAANKFAEDSDSSVGVIMQAQQGQFSITNRDEYTPWIKNIRVVTYVNYAIN